MKDAVIELVAIAALVAAAAGEAYYFGGWGRLTRFAKGWWLP